MFTRLLTILFLLLTLGAAASANVTFTTTYTSTASSNAVIVIDVLWRETSAGYNTGNPTISDTQSALGALAGSTNTFNYGGGSTFAYAAWVGWVPITGKLTSDTITLTFTDTLTNASVDRSIVGVVEVDGSGSTPSEGGIYGGEINGNGTYTEASSPVSVGYYTVLLQESLVDQVTSVSQTQGPTWGTLTTSGTTSGSFAWATGQTLTTSTTGPNATFVVTPSNEPGTSGTYALDSIWVIPFSGVTLTPSGPPPYCFPF